MLEKTKHEWVMELVGEDFLTPQPLELDDTAAGLAIKVYEEQCPNGFEDVLKRVRRMNSWKYVCAAIKHTGSGKEHLHIMVKPLDTSRRLRVKSILRQLNIFFRPGIDDQMMENRGLETLGHISTYAQYLLHKTKEAQDAQKIQYSLDDIVSNLNRNELKTILEAYQPRQKRKSPKVVHEELCKAAYTAGFDMLQNYDDWSAVNLPAGLSQAKLREIRSFYMNGFRSGVSETRNFTRLCLHVAGPIKETTAKLERSFSDIGLRSFTVRNQTSELLNMSMDTDALILWPGIENDLRINILSTLQAMPALLGKKLIWKGSYVISLSPVETKDWKMFSPFSKISKTVMDEFFWSSTVSGDHLVFQSGFADDDALKTSEKKELFVKLRNAYNAVPRVDSIALNPAEMNA